MADNSKIDRILKDMEALNAVDTSKVGSPSASTLATAEAPATRGSAGAASVPSRAERADRRRGDEALDGRRKRWWGQLLAALVVAVLWAVLFLLVAPFLVQWWVDLLGTWVNGDYYAGILFGLAFGAVSALVTALLLIPVLSSRTGWVISLIFAILASAGAFGWILSLSALFAPEANSMRARESLTVERVGEFHLAAGISSIVVLLLVLAALGFALSYRRRGRQLRELRGGAVSDRTAQDRTAPVSTVPNRTAPATTTAVTARTAPASTPAPAPQTPETTSAAEPTKKSDKKDDGPDYSDWMSKIE
ncbi:hypothetical protein [Haematomicrobium sanguinis]|uniref:hypothetical protein n=1 Tax=Haematomicrobium sanguinis TaxID=479106 RepID=UPI00047EBD0B|nr:hypothetical protein [Haematomicrobium sanguinis]